MKTGSYTLECFSKTIFLINLLFNSFLVIFISLLHTSHKLSKIICHFSYRYIRSQSVNILLTAKCWYQLEH